MHPQDTSTDSVFAQTPRSHSVTLAPVLLVDDRAENLQALQGLLAEEPVAVTAVQSGEAALRALLLKEFALVMLDVHMPDMDGFEVAELMRANRRTRNVPIIFITAAIRDEGHVFRGYEHGAVDFLYKPIEPRIVRSKVRVFVELYQSRKRLEMVTAELRESLRRLQEQDEALRRRQHLEALGKLVGGVAHEIRNPLSFMMSHLRRSGRIVDRVRAQCGACGTSEECDAVVHQLEEIRRGVSVAHDGAVRINHIVQDLSQFAHTSGGKATHPVCLSHVAQRVLDLAAHDVAGTAQVETQFEGDEWVRADENKLFQLFLNLLTNAVHAVACARRPDGRIIVRTWTAGDRCLVCVIDNGCGIAPEHQGRIFDPFFSTKKEGEGSGLGLAISYGIVSALGGDIHVDSAPGRGAAFTVSLPRCPEPGGA